MEAMDPKVPLARQEGLVVHELQDEVLVYDRQRHRAHSLNQVAALVWRHCDGKTSIRELSGLLHREMGLPCDEELVYLALDRLGRARLLEGRPSLPSGLPSSARRAVLRSAAMAGALAVVSSIVAPKAEASGSACTISAQCLATGCCCICTKNNQPNQNKGCQTSGTGQGSCASLSAAGFNCACA
jgi:hypothetical protein